MTPEQRAKKARQRARQRSRRRKMVRAVDGIKKGTFVNARLTGEHATLWVEGDDQDHEPVVAGIALTADGLTLLVSKLEKLRDKMMRRSLEALAKKAKADAAAAKPATVQEALARLGLRAEDVVD